jgi:D-amino peptidase
VRVHVISDMEGVAGIVKWEQTTGGESLYEEGRKLYTEEINAAVRGAKAAGATEILVMDCHGAGKGWTFNSLVAEDLDPACEFVVQDEWTEYTEFLETGCDAALFVGMHSRAGTGDGVMNHTISGRDFQNLWFNGTLVGETASTPPSAEPGAARCSWSPATTRPVARGRSSWATVSPRCRSSAASAPSARGV